MKRLLVTIVTILLIPAVAPAESIEPGKVMIFPLKTVSKDGKVGYSNDPAIVLGSELSREGDLEIISGAPYLSVVKRKKVDPARISRMAQRMNLAAVFWGTLTTLEDGYSIEVAAVGKNPRKKARYFSATGKNMEELLSRVQEMAVQIGRVVFNRPVIGSIKIEGNRRIQRDAILNKMGMKQGTAFQRSAVGDEIRDIYSMGYFDDVKIVAENDREGKVDLRIVLKERPSIKKIELKGNTVFSKDDILDNLTIRSFSVASLEKIRKDIAKIKRMYEKKGYYEPKVDYDIKELSRNEAKLILTIDEGAKSFLTRVVFDGRKRIPEKELKKILTVKEKSWIWFLDDSGTFTRQDLEQNRLRLIGYYQTKGFMNVQVGAPKMEVREGSVVVTYPIREGDRFQIRNVDVDGDLIMPKEKLIEPLQAKPKTWVNRQLIGDDIRALTRLYNNAGYAYADVQPSQRINDEYDFLDLTYNITKGPRVTIERVDIRGNERTRGKVVRRGLLVNEGDLYNADRLEGSKKNLERSEFFEAVQMKTSPGSSPDKMNLVVELLEKKTGSLAAGLGYSSQDKAMGNIDLKERNLLGLGIVANVKANVSGRRTNYEGSLTYPWLFDIPLSASVQGYSQQRKETQYVRQSDGFSFHFGYPIYGFWSASAGFARDSSKLTGMERIFARSVVDYYAEYGVKAEKFMDPSENSVSLGLVRDTRSGSPIPSAGSKITFGSRFSGFGGDLEFSKYYSEAVYYRKLFWRAIVKAKANGSAMVESGDSPIPFDRRIVLGGISSIRGYQYGQIGPRDKYGSMMGGDRAVFANLECLFPLLDMLKLRGVVFVDAGNSWNAKDSPFLTDVKAGAGLGVRWLSPMGPMRIEYGWKLNREKGESPGAVAFGMGQLF